MQRWPLCTTLPDLDPSGMDQTYNHPAAHQRCPTSSVRDGCRLHAAATAHEARSGPDQARKAHCSMRATATAGLQHARTNRCRCHHQQYRRPPSSQPAKHRRKEKRGEGRGRLTHSHHVLTASSRHHHERAEFHRTTAPHAERRASLCMLIT